MFQFLCVVTQRILEEVQRTRQSFSFFVLLQRSFQIWRNLTQQVLVSLCCYDVVKIVSKYVGEVLVSLCCYNGDFKRNSKAVHEFQFLCVVTRNGELVFSLQMKLFQFLCVVTVWQDMVQSQISKVLVSLCCYIDRSLNN